jgi:hypothetical protein
MNEEFNKEAVVERLVSLLLKANQEDSYTYYKFMIDKHREEWPELWHHLDDLMYLAYIEDKFIDPK